MPFKILVVDDKIDDTSEEISALPELLRKAGYEARTTSDENKAWDLVWEYHPDLIVLDIDFRDKPTYGIELCEAIRLDGNETPIILVTAVRKETETVLRGFKAGADDYVRRPQGNREIMARIRANLPPEAVVVDDYLRVDFASRRVWVRRNGDWQEIHLSPRLWQLLETLVINAGLIVPMTSIKDRVYGKPVGDSALFKAVHDLRRKLEPDPGDPVYIEVVKGIGYRFSGTLTRASPAPPAEGMHLPSGAKHASASGHGVAGIVAAQDAPALKARLMAHAEEAVDRLLTGKSQRKDLQPGDIERLVNAAGAYVIERFTGELAGESR